MTLVKSLVIANRLCTVAATAAEPPPLRPKAANASAQHESVVRQCAYAVMTTRIRHTARLAKQLVWRRSTSAKARNNQLVVPDRAAEKSFADILK